MFIAGMASALGTFSLLWFVQCLLIFLVSSNNVADMTGIAINIVTTEF